MKGILYGRKGNRIEWILAKDAMLTYPAHTHANHLTFGFILAGTVCVNAGGEKRLYHAGDRFCIFPDTLHAVGPVDNIAYSMISVCVPVCEPPDEDGNETDYTKRLKRLILQAPENRFPIGDMAQRTGVSPYHLIRRFKAACGLTPHQFQIQCRVRKAQKLLEEGESVTEAAYAAGFCDQSHFDRCFRKIVRLTPGEYKKAVSIVPE